jgi:hypothetical protein
LELFGIIFSIPGAFLASVTYRCLLSWFSEIYPLAAPMIFFASRCVLIAILMEWAALATWSAVELHQFLGVFYYKFHSLLFFAGTPSLINVIVLADPQKRRWITHLVLPLATLLGFNLVVVQYSVSESIFGIE